MCVLLFPVTCQTQKTHKGKLFMATCIHKLPGCNFKDKVLNYVERDMEQERERTTSSFLTLSCSVIRTGHDVDGFPFDLYNIHPSKSLIMYMEKQSDERIQPFLTTS
ncbi:hypothetical protein chiPu_0012869 [Chiloscyllium punctatum]|uniref:Uncharacterized protein n=1 Tax=Chiloscyllium punctatum TaxID=137246 RepID=A0A401SVM1_CHIPU|nr:hypothetical protein [Chiloscyllium punctatum]